jgi:pyruvate/2-oxoglutarate dehydrogenase complex dihydrolipoamide dehydrogenase (E3) component
MTDVVVIGAGPAGMIAALCAADLGARVALVARTEFGGMRPTMGRSRYEPCLRAPG